MLCTLNASASGHIMLLSPIRIPQTLLPLCFHPKSDPTRLVLHGAARPLAWQLVSEENSGVRG